ncbi:MAG TPA: hypothetical protein VIK99_01610 [Thermaerobacter sp.]
MADFSGFEHEHAWEQVKGFKRDLAMTVAGYKMRLEEYGLRPEEPVRLASEWQREFQRSVFQQGTKGSPGS